MPRATLIQTNFTAGEISPRMLGRIDVARYANGAKKIENAYPLIHGGVIRRPGSRFVAAAKYGAKKVRLIPYIFNSSQAYVLEFGDLYMRVFKDGAQVLATNGQPVEVVTPYTEAMLSRIEFVQGADTMFLAHPEKPIHRLRRISHSDWVLAAAPFVAEPFDDIGFYPSAGLSLSGKTAGVGRTATADNSVFLASDVGREIWAGAGVARITAVASGVSATVDVIIPFSDLLTASGSWKIKGSPQTTCTPSAKDPVGASITLSLPTAGTSSSNETAKTVLGAAHAPYTYESPPGSEQWYTAATVTIVLPGHGYVTGNTVIMGGFTPTGFNGTYTITKINENSFYYTVSGDPGVPTGLGTSSRVITSNGAGGWRNSDVGKYVRVNRGLVKITAVANASSATGTIIAALDSIVAAPANAWSIESAVWNEKDGYPSSVTLSEQRLIAAGSPGFPQTIWMSRTGESLNFELGTKDDDAMSFTISSDQINPIAHLAQTKSMVALTYGGEFTIFGGVEKPLSPTNIQVKNQSAYGCSAVKPVRIGNELYFIQRANRKVRAMAYRFESDGYSAPDMSVLSEHATDSGIVEMAYQQEPESVLWLVRADGVLATLSIDREQDVVGWARQITDGSYESVATIPVANGDECWVAVRRVINGQTVRYIERFDAGTNVDAGIVGTSVAGATTWGGLAHLEGEEVDVVADDVVMQRATVANGEITLSRKAYKVHIGIPYVSTVQTLTPELPSGEGSAQGNSMRCAEVTVRMKDTVGMRINGQVVVFRDIGANALDKAVAPFSGDYRMENLGWERGESLVTIEQTQPLPMHVLSVIKKMTVNS
jgi:hypothetical protein